MRLRDISCPALAREVISGALDEAHRILFGLAPFSAYTIVTGDPLDPSTLRPLTADSGETSTVGEAVTRLVAYAQTGAPLDADVHEYCVTLIPVAGEALDDSGEPDPSTALGLVVQAALARERIEGGWPVTVHGLAALASLSTAQVRSLCASGEIRATRSGDAPRRPAGDSYEVTAEEARRWLGARGVLGFR